MRYLLSALLLLALPTAMIAQTQADYEHTMADFMKFYNNSQAEGIRKLCSDKMANDKKSLQFTPELMTKWHSDFGEMTNYKYIRKMHYRDDSVVVVKMEFARFINGIAITLDKDKRIEQMWFINSPRMDPNDEKKPKPKP